MAGILVIVERARHGIDDATFELATAARSLAAGDPVVGLVIGAGAAELAAQLTPWFQQVLVADDGSHAGDGVAHARLIADVIADERPAVTLMAHTNVGIDIAPRAAVLAGLPMASDCLEVESQPDGLLVVRTVYGGKVYARVRLRTDASGALLTLRPGAIAASSAPGAGGTVVTRAPRQSAAPGRRFIETVATEAGAVDLTQAEVLVSVGRGIEEESNLRMVRDLAAALGAELACTRPVVDKGWLPKAHQVGTSGVSVKPRVYLAAGVSGSYQHMGGVKGGPFIIAINEDAGAPIFSVADVGIVGDLFDILPLLERKIRESRG